jgi:hypothetical protein
MHNHQRGGRQLLFLAVSVEGGLAVLAWGLGWLLRQPPLHGWRWDLPDALLGLAAGLPMLALFLLCVRWPVGPLRRIKEFSEEIIRPLFASCTLLDLALISSLAGVGEEMFFRGFLQALLARWLSAWAALATASALFGLLHLITPTYALLATAMGAYLGWLWVVNGNLLVVVIAHALYDFVALVCLVRRPAARPQQRPPPVPEVPH